VLGSPLDNMHPGYRPWVQPSRLASTCPWGWDRNIADPTTPTPPRVRGTQQARRAGVRIVRVDRGLSHKHPWVSRMHMHMHMHMHMQMQMHMHTGHV
jgi:hypothetical protein